MFSRTALYALVAAVSLVLAGVQAIGADERLPEASLIGLGQEIAGSALRASLPPARATLPRVLASRR